MGDLMLTFLIGITSGGFTFIGILVQRDRKQRDERDAKHKAREEAKEQVQAELDDNFRLMVFGMLRLSLATAHSHIDGNGSRATVERALIDVEQDSKVYEKNNITLTKKLATLLSG